MSENNSMRYCTNCGKAVPPGEMFCTRCGSRIEGQDIPIAYTTYAQSEKKGVNKIVLVFGVICALCVVVVGATLFLRKGQPANNVSTTATPAAEMAKETAVETAQSAEEATPATEMAEKTAQSAEEATTAPAPTPSQPASSTDPGAASAPAVAPSFPNYSASSSLAPDAYTSYYGPLNAIDNDMLTAWVEGVDGFGAGEWIRLGADTPQTVQGVKVLGGYTKSEDLYYRNNRPRLVTITLSDGYSRQFELSDDFGKWQSIDFDGPHQSTYVQFIIESVYGGSKWDDTCVSEFSAY